MGLGIWAMHYVGMLALDLPVEVFYHWPTVLLSLFTAMLASGVALFAVSRKAMGLLRTGIGGLFMGIGIASMHYIGMNAMRLRAMCRYSTGLVVLSVVLAVLISMVALWLTFQLRDETAGAGWRKLASPAIMGTAIPVMHYTGMAAVTFDAHGDDRKAGLLDRDFFFGNRGYQQRHADAAGPDHLDIADRPPLRRSSSGAAPPDGGSRRRARSSRAIRGAPTPHAAVFWCQRLELAHRDGYDGGG